MAVTKLDYSRAIKTRHKLKSSLAKQPPLKALSPLMFIKPQQLKEPTWLSLTVCPELCFPGCKGQGSTGLSVLSPFLEFSTRPSCFGVLLRNRCFISSSSYHLEIICEAHEVPVARQRCVKEGNVQRWGLSASLTRTFCFLHMLVWLH